MWIWESELIRIRDPTINVGVNVNVNIDMHIDIEEGPKKIFPTPGGHAHVRTFGITG